MADAKTGKTVAVSVAAADATAWVGAEPDSPAPKALTAAGAALSSDAAATLTVGLFTYSGYPDGCPDDLLITTVAAAGDAKAAAAVRAVPLVWDSERATAKALITPGAADAALAAADVKGNGKAKGKAQPNAAAAAAGAGAGASASASACSYDLLVLRSTWDYHTRADAFTAWLRALYAERALRARVYNPIAVALWNAEKHKYLPLLAAQGIAIADTVWLPKGAAAADLDLQRVMAARGWTRAVIKPVVSAGSHATRVTAHPSPSTADQQFLAASVAQYAVALQQYLPEVVAPGEWSLVHFNGVLSHATLKSPTDVDRNKLNTRSKPATPPPHVIAYAQKVLSCVPLTTAPAAGADADDPANDPVLRVPLRDSCLYARVDMVDRTAAGAGVVLMELELLEPFLSLANEPAAAPKRFVEAMRQRVDAVRKAKA